MSAIDISYESVAVSSRIRLARNFKDYPFPARLIRSPYAEEQAQEMIRLLSAELANAESFVLYDMRSVSKERAAYLQERYLISRDLIRHRKISAALVSRKQNISIMINEEDHIREQYFAKGLDLRNAYEGISGIDEIISDSIPFAYDKEFGYLTACPTNLGTGLRASVMLFLPAIVRRGLMNTIIPALSPRRLTVRGGYGEGSVGEGDLFQVSNEVTIGYSEQALLSLVERAVDLIVETELRERERMKVEEGLALRDKVLRSYGILTNCVLLGEKEFASRMADVKLGIALGFFGKATVVKGFGDPRIHALDDIILELRPANINLINGSALTQEEQDAYRAEYLAKALPKAIAGKAHQ